MNNTKLSFVNVITISQLKRVVKILFQSFFLYHDYHGLSWTIINYHGLSWTIVDCHGLVGPQTKTKIQKKIWTNIGVSEKIQLKIFNILLHDIYSPFMRLNI